MAAVIMTLRSSRSRLEEQKSMEQGNNGQPGSGASVLPHGEDPEQTFRASHFSNMDRDGDGKISVEELIPHLRNVSVRIDMAMNRLTLERDLSVMMFKIPFFVSCLLVFLAALATFSPAADVAKVHRHLVNHFKLLDAEGISNFEGIYKYIEAFEKRNEELQATSAKYWCEERYYEHKWDADLIVPSRTCQSPRQHALGVGESSSHFRWQEWYKKKHGSYPAGSSLASSANTASSSAAAGASSGSSASHGRRMFEGVDAAWDLARRRLAVLQQLDADGVPTCEDNDYGLQLEEGKPDATCKEEAYHVCEVDIGILLCPKTCGYCSPFYYQRMHQFPKPQLTLLPIVVFQTRFKTAECHGYAAKYMRQEVNPSLNILPALDGEKADSLITCIDRNAQFDDEYAIELECGEGHSPLFCPPCSFNASKFCLRDTARIDFHGIPVYPMMIIEPKRAILRMRAMDWLNINTDAVHVSTVVYTEGSEIFTSLTVEFMVDEAGNIHEYHKLISYRDLTGSTKATFIGCMIACSACAFLGIFVTLYEMYVENIKCNWGLQAYELFSRSMLFAYPLALLVSWTQQVPMSEEFDQLLHAILDMKGLNRETMREAMTKYFLVKTHIYSETSWLKRHRVVANLVLYLQFWQLMLYFSAHPKMAMLTDTISKALQNIIHFLFLFMLLFCMMAFMAHWQLGEFIKVFSTYGDAISAQGRMIFGEFIYADGANRLHGIMMAMYWLYAFTFLLVMWGLLLNFFLAIVVDAFADVSATNTEAVHVKSFMADCLDVFRVYYLRKRHGWPSASKLIDFLKEMEDSQKDKQAWLDKLDADHTVEDMEEEADHKNKVHPEELQEKFPKEFDTDKKIAIFLCHYFDKMPKLLRRRRDGTTEEGVVQAPSGRMSRVSEGSESAAMSNAVGAIPAAAKSQADQGDLHRELARIATLNMKLLDKHQEMQTKQDEMQALLAAMNGGTTI